ncbi:HAMP domain-containing sensor histidine kinase [Fictibacillus barbaricus]|uniref:histidine kinase n=1 Tax=Fictibacillus barbaricus TaxID=182136 RepID=A0ABU1TV52_9BACL|nr:HAMP domain-containing sensor histidine kinase [Fictibacillus barbaricus]MDR7071081.1 two-component system sporulation sensor kinase B [Fictibacillus barbaricus]
MEITKHLLFNLSLLMLFIFVCIVWSLKKKESRISKTATVVCGIAAMWTCIAFAYELTDNTRFDLREIPVIIGGLYVGIGPILAIASIVIRGFYGLDFGFFINILIYGPLGLLLWRVYPWFWKRSSKCRVIIAIGITLLSSLATVTVMEIVNLKLNHIDALFAFLIIPPLSMLIISCTIEFVRSDLHMRQQLFKSEKLAAVEQMGAAISHEIRNPLTVSKGFVQLLEKESISADKQKEYLSLIKEGLDSAEKVIQDYLTFSKPSIDSMDELNIQHELNQIISFLIPTANQHSVLISAEFIPSIYVLGDGQKFSQCLLNVMKNGIESMPDGGTLSVSVKKKENKVIIEIKDTGVGMTKEQMNKLGEPYYSTKGANGTGLGMMVAFSVIRAMKGSVYITSELGKGTIFSLQFPAFEYAAK